MKRQRGIGKVLGLGVLAGVMALAGCSTGGSAASAPQGAGGVANDAGAMAPDAPMPTTDRMIARTASVTLVVGDVKVAVGSLQDVATSLSQRVETASIDVSLSTEASAQQTTGVGSAFIAGWHALGTAARYLLIAIAAVLPWAAVVALVLVPIILVRRKRRTAAVSASVSRPMPTPAVQPISAAQSAPADSLLIEPQPVANPDVATPPPTVSKRTSRAKPKPQ